MKKPTSIVLFIALTSTLLYGQQGILKIKSEQSVSQTAEKLQSMIKEKGLTLFTVVNHSNNAANVDMNLRPTVLVIFGNPKLGTPLMQCQQTYALDLPQKALIFENEKGEVWIAYNNQTYLAQRHDMQKCQENLAKIEKALQNLLQAAAKK